jgi:hypothetical protein
MSVGMRLRRMRPDIGAPGRGLDLGGRRTDTSAAHGWPHRPRAHRYASRRRRYEGAALPQWFHRGVLRTLRFPGKTVPALDGRRIQTLTAIARALDDVRPEPRLVPADPRVAPDG